MNENTQVRGSSSNVGSVAVGFLVGAVVGAGIALLLAPESGKDTRRRLADTGAHWGDVTRRKMNRVRSAVNDLRQDAKSALAAGREALEQGSKSQEPRPSPDAETKAQT